MKEYLIIFFCSLLLGVNFNEAKYPYTFVDSSILCDESKFIDSLKDNFTTDILEIQTGKLSRYGPDCYGCSGYLAYGDYVGDGTIYYYDNEYGYVRILAGDRKYQFGTIIKVVTNDEEFLGIVLDRGGAIGFDRVALFDLLYPSEYLANIDGVSYNTEFSILRYGF